MKHEKYYVKNKEYTIFLDSQERETFRKYSDTLKKFSRPRDKILDVGCGTGIALELIRQNSSRDLYGIEVSQESVKVAKKKKLRCIVYDGKTLPYKNDYFHVVGSMNVLEHTDEPVQFLNEQLRVLRKGGYLVISCPNFLSISNSYHHHTRGMTQKLKNFSAIMIRIVKPRAAFSKMKTIDREDFQPDDDACNVTNPLNILTWAKTYNLQLMYWSSQPNYTSGLKRFLDHGIVKVILGASFMVFKK